MEKLMSSQADRWMEGRAEIWRKRQMKGRTFEQTNRESEVRISGCTNRQTDGWKEELLN